MDSGLVSSAIGVIYYRIAVSIHRLNIHDVMVPDGDHSGGW
jgi:hypothetical protein